MKKKTLQTGITRNVYIGNITATVSEIERYNDAERNHHPYLPFTSSICGIPDHCIENLTLENIQILILGGFPVRKATEVLREIPENSNKYPENRMWDVLPAHGFYLRHIRGLNIDNITIITKQEDGLPVFMLDDVHDARFTNLKAENTRLTPMLAVVPGCSNIQMS